MRLKQLIYHSRPINLVIVAITQFIIIAFLYSWEFSSLHLTFKPLMIFSLILLCTILITISGYLINDYFDYEIDSINKSNSARLRKIELLAPYFIILLLGLVIALFIAYRLGNLMYTFNYFLAVAMLFLYASHFKSTGLFGNFIVSIFSSLVIGIIWYVYELIHQSATQSQGQVLIIFMSFIFLISMAREIVKDCQDLEGDAKFGLQTLPIKIGIYKAVIFAGFFLGALITICLFWLYHSFSNLPINLNVLLGIIIALVCFTMIKVLKSKTEFDFKSSSKLLKICMALGIFYLLAISFQL